MEEGDLGVELMSGRHRNLPLHFWILSYLGTLPSRVVFTITDCVFKSSGDWRDVGLFLQVQLCVGGSTDEVDKEVCTDRW